MNRSPEIEQALLARHGRWKGGELWFLCLNHEDTKPTNASWNPEKMCWHCFVCGAGGGFLDLANRLGLSVSKSPTSSFTNTSRRLQLPTFCIDWRYYANQFRAYGDTRFLRGQRILSAAKGLDTSTWTDVDWDSALAAVNEAYADLDEAERVEDLATNLHCLALEEERHFHESRR